MKVFVVLACIFQVAFTITLPEINELITIFSGARLDSSMLQNYARYIIHRNTSSDSNDNSNIVENFSQISELLKKYSSGDGVVQVQNLLEDVMNQLKIMSDILKGRGIAEQKILAVAFPIAYNDIVHMLSLNAHKLSVKINVINLKKPENPKFKVPKPHKTTRKTYRRAFRLALKEAKRLKVLAPRITRNMPPQTSIIGDFQKIVTNFADLIEKSFTSSPAHAAGAKEIVSNLATNFENIMKILERNGIKGGPIVFEIAATIFVDMISELKHFIFAI